jgi:hypothetical protein
VIGGFDVVHGPTRICRFQTSTTTYGSTWGRIDGQRAAAQRTGGIAPVENRATALMKRQDRDTAVCIALDEKAHAAIAKVNERLVDRFLETRRSTPPVARTPSRARGGSCSGPS